MNGVTLTENAVGVTVRIPIKMKKCGGRKEIMVSEGLDQAVPQPNYQEPFVIALARAYCWQELLDSGKYSSIREMAGALGICSTYMARLLRFTLLAPDIIEAILNGNEPNGFSQNKLICAIPADWNEQRRKWGFAQID